MAKPNQPFHLHIGCFDQVAPGWYNTDITPYIFISRIPFLASLLYFAGAMSRERYSQNKRRLFREVHYLDLRKQLPFPSDSVDACFSSHTLEHLYVWETKRLLGEVHRALKPGGFVRLILPDLGHAVSSYDIEEPVPFLSMVFKKEDLTNHKNQHKWMFTGPYMERLLRDAGFTSVHRMGSRSIGGVS